MSVEQRLEEQEKMHAKGGACDLASAEKWKAIGAISTRLTRLETIVWIASVVGPLIVEGIMRLFFKC